VERREAVHVEKNGGGIGSQGTSVGRSVNQAD
jgi:hypothetical protein